MNAILYVSALISAIGMLVILIRDFALPTSAIIDAVVSAYQTITHPLGELVNAALNGMGLEVDIDRDAPALLIALLAAGVTAYRETNRDLASMWSPDVKKRDTNASVYAAAFAFALAVGAAAQFGMSVGFVIGVLVVYVLSLIRMDGNVLAALRPQAVTTFLTFSAALVAVVAEKI